VPDSKEIKHDFNQKDIKKEIVKVERKRQRRDRFYQKKIGAC